MSKAYLHGILDGVQLGQRGVSVSPIGLERSGDGIGANSMAEIELNMCICSSIQPQQCS